MEHTSWRRRTAAVPPGQAEIIAGVVLGTVALVGCILSADSLLMAAARDDAENRIIAIVGLGLGATALGCTALSLIRSPRHAKRLARVALDGALFRGRVEARLRAEQRTHAVARASDPTAATDWTATLEEGHRWYGDLVKSGATHEAELLISLLAEVQRLAEEGRIAGENRGNQGDPATPDLTMEQPRATGNPPDGA
jgi:hypothetical protein